MSFFLVATTTSPPLLIFDWTQVLNVTRITIIFSTIYVYRLSDCCKLSYGQVWMWVYFPPACCIAINPARLVYLNKNIFTCHTHRLNYAMAHHFLILRIIYFQAPFIFKTVTVLKFVDCYKMYVEYLDLIKSMWLPKTTLLCHAMLQLHNIHGYLSIWFATSVALIGRFQLGRF